MYHASVRQFPHSRPPNKTGEGAARKAENEVRLAKTEELKRINEAKRKASDTANDEIQNAPNSMDNPGGQPPLPAARVTYGICQASLTGMTETD